MTSNRLRFVALVLATCIGAAPLLAVAQARLFGFIKDENGQPVANATITVTLPDSDFKVAEKSDANGKYSLALVDATRTYKYRIEAPGMAPYEEMIKIPIGANQARDFQMLSAKAAREKGMSGGNKAVVTFNAGVEAMQAGDEAGATAKFQEAITLDPSLPQPYNALATIFMRQKKYQEALGMAEKALAADATNTAALQIRVEAYKGLGDTAKAAEAQTALNAADPASAALELYNQGVELYNAGKTDEALVVLEKSAATDDSYARTHYMLGLCYTSSGKTAEAREHFEKFIQMAPDDPDVPTAKEMLSYL